MIYLSVISPVWRRIGSVFLACGVLSILSGFSGCISSGETKRYYQLFLPPSAAAETVAVGASDNMLPAPIFEHVLMVEAVDIEDIYNDYRVVYRTSPHQLNYYAYQFWIKKPGRLVRDAIQDYLVDSGIFKKVIARFSQGDPDLLLKARVYIIEEVDQAHVWYARLKMEMEFKDFKTGEQILLHSFNRQLPLPQKKVENLPTVISKILKEELVTLLEKFPTALKDRISTSKK